MVEHPSSSSFPKTQRKAKNWLAELESDWELACWKGERIKGWRHAYKLILASRASDYRNYATRVGIAAVLLSALVVIPAAFIYGGVVPALESTGVLFALCGLALTLPALLAARIREEIERPLVNALYVASRLPAGTPSRAVLSRISQCNEFGLLQEVFAEGYNSYIKSGGRRGMEETLQSIQDRVRSPKLDRMIQTFILGTKNNKDASTLLLKTAEDLEDIQELRKDRRASLALQKYTVLSASALFVPFILGTTAGCLKFLEGMGSAVLYPASGSASASAAAVGFALLGYSMILAVLSSLWVAFGIDDRPSLVAVYLPVVLLLNVFLFSLSSLMLVPS